MERNHSTALVSVVITTYNRAGLVCRAIDSVLTQLYQAVEVIVVDDGSTDGTMDVLRRYEADPRVRTICHSSNRGVTAAKNTGLDAVLGAFTTMVDSDDELLPEAIDSLVNTFAALGPSYGMVFANGRDSQSGEATGRGLMESGDVTYRDAITGRFSGDFWGLWRTPLLGALRFDERVPGLEGLVWHRLYRNTSVHYVHRQLAKFYRDGADRVTRQAPTPERAGRIALGCELYIQEFGADIGSFDARRLSRELQIMALWLLMAGQRRKAFRALISAMVTRPSALSIALTISPLVPPKILWTMVEGRSQ